MADFIVFAIIAAIVGAAVVYIYKAKKSGVKCIGCPSGCKCSSSQGGCSSCTGDCGCHSQKE